VFSVIPYRPLKIFGSKNWGDICIKLNKKSMGFIKIDKTGARDRTQGPRCWNI